MTIVARQPIPQLRTLPTKLPLDHTIRLEFEEGFLLFRTTPTVQARTEFLLATQSSRKLTCQEEHELDLYEEIDDYLSFVNRTIHNLC